MILSRVAAVCIVGFAMSAGAQQNTQNLIIGEQLTLHSSVLKEDRPYWVYLPQSYATAGAAGRTYPVLYLLDGRAHFNALTGIVHHLSADSSAVWRIPEVIVVAPSNTKRTRDFTPTHVTSGPYSQDSGGAATFLRFMQEELIPKIESTYSVLPERTLVGHSLGGLFVLSAFIERPELFRNYIAIDPSLWWDDQVLMKRLRRQPASQIMSPVNVFIATASAPVDRSEAPAKERHDDAIRQFASILEQRKGGPLRVQSRHFDDETHLSVPLVAMYRGLLFAYEGYERPTSTSMRVPSGVDATLRLELLQLKDEDQAIRHQLIAHGMERPDPAIEARMLALNTRNSERMRAIIQQHGWPTASLVGRDGVDAAFLLVQHGDLPLQQEVLPLVERAFKAGEMRGESYALLLDRVRVREGKPQVYGMQARPTSEWREKEPLLYPIEDEANVDERRAQLGLPPLRDYLEVLKKIYFP